MTREIKHRLGGGTYLVEETNKSGISHFKLNNEAETGGIYASAVNLYEAGERLKEIARDKGYQPFPKEPVEPQPEPQPEPDFPSTFQVGDRVQVVAAAPLYGWGSVNRFDIGTVKKIVNDEVLVVNFTAQRNWWGKPEEFIKAPSASQSLSGRRADMIIVDDVVETKPKSPPRYVNLTDQAKTIFRHIMRAGSISAREAMNDYGITSATLARRICDLEEEGYNIERVSKVHPITHRKYTRYSFPRSRT